MRGTFQIFDFDSTEDITDIEFRRRRVIRESVELEKRPEHTQRLPTMWKPSLNGFNHIISGAEVSSISWPVIHQHFRNQLNGAYRLKLIGHFQVLLLPISVNELPMRFRWIVVKTIMFWFWFLYRFVGRCHSVDFGYIGVSMIRILVVLPISISCFQLCSELISTWSLDIGWHPLFSGCWDAFLSQWLLKSFFFSDVRCCLRLTIEINNVRNCSHMLIHWWSSFLFSDCLLMCHFSYIDDR